MLSRLASRFAAALAPTALLLALGLAGCKTAWERPVPEPLPEDLAWRTVAAPEGAFLGVRVRENDSGSLEDLFFQEGVRVTHVVANSPAERAGLREGDVLLSFDGVAVNDSGALEALGRAAVPGASVALEVQRGDLVRGVEVALSPRVGSAGAAGAADVTEPTVLYRLDRSRSLAGWSTAPGGVRLVSARADSPFPRAGVPVGSTVTSLEGEPVLSDRDLVRRLVAREPGSEILAGVRAEDGSEREVLVRLAVPRSHVTGLSIPVLCTWEATADGRRASLVVLDLWVISLMRYEREGKERTWRFLRFFEFSTGSGELEE